MEEEAEQHVEVDKEEEDVSSASDDDDADDRVFLGFVDPSERGDRNADFLSVIGGRPSFPHWPRAAGEATSLLSCCESCGAGLVLLCQVFAPLDWISPNAFHRFVYVLVCTRPACWRSSKRCVSVLRIQWREGQIPSPPKAVCFVCGKPATKACSRCHRRHYCSAAHQVIDWKQGGHKRRCGSEVDGAAAPQWTRAADDPSFVLKRLVMVSEEEERPERFADAEEEKEGEQAGEAISATASGAAVAKAIGLSSEAEAMQRAVKADSVFLRFQARTKLAQDQVLRYCFGAKRPLWVNSERQLIGSPPDCVCGSRRVFELQVMPQVLFYLDLDSREETAMDWSSIVVYSCERSCEASFAEFAFVH